MKQWMNYTSVAALLLANQMMLHAQSTQTYADLYYDPAANWVSGIAVTYPDYSAQFYYDPRVDVQLLGTDGFYDQYTCSTMTPCRTSEGYAWAGLTVSPQPGANYTLWSQHYLDTYYNYYIINSSCGSSCYDWYDGYGYSFSQCQPGCTPTSNPPCYCIDVTTSSPGLLWWPPMIAVTTMIAQQSLGSNARTMQNPVPILEVHNGGTLVGSGQTTYISAGGSTTPPLMPSLSAQLIGAGLTGSTTWRIRVQYNGHGRNDGDSFPTSSAQTLPSTTTWNIQSAFGGSVRGGTATITYKYDNRPERSFSFQILGTNPSEADAKNYVVNGGGPWFLSRLVRKESGYRQFDSSQPLFGPPNGWGIMQLDPPPGSQEIWNWWSNINQGKNVVNQKNSDLGSTWNNRIQEWNTWNQQHPTQQVAAPGPRAEANCSFTWLNGGSGSEAQKSFRDACWIKRYNGASGGDYLIWDNVTNPSNPAWVFKPLNSSNVNYVNAVCSQPQ